MVTLPQLIDGLPLSLHCGGPVDIPLTSLADDSRQVQPGALFIAREGVGADGEQFITDAIERGAAAIIAPRPPRTETETSPVWASGPKIDMALTARLADRFFGHPARDLAIAAVTGTNGKTTVAFLVRHLLERAGMRCGLLGTVHNDLGRGVEPAALTTPGPIELHRSLRQMVDAGCDAVACELSSHGLEQGRAAGLDVDVAIFTNLTGDHLDYHGTMEDYAAAKARLFEMLKPPARAVVNAEDAWTKRIVADCEGSIIRCAVDAAAEVEWRAEVLSLSAAGSRIAITSPRGRDEVSLPLLGRHNVSNALLATAAADAVCESRGLDTAGLCAFLAEVGIVPGRLEPVSIPGDETAPTVLVDYAHTDDALFNVLTALRPLLPEAGRLSVVFGCGGDRDRTKRPRMAEVASRLADELYVTSDNPRTEPPQQIIDDILSGLPAGTVAGESVHVEPDRARAIEQAITAAGSRHIVLIAGKGDEDYQIIGTERTHFDDREQAATALQERRRKSAPAPHERAWTSS